MKVSTVFCLALLFFSLGGQLALAADVKLPPPQTEGGMGLFEAIKKRSSAQGSSYNSAELSLEELSTVLWAASGLNRPDKWTVPMAMGAKPYCKIYALGSDGAWLYDWADHSLKEVAKENLKPKVGAQDFVERASYVLIFVSDPSGLKSFGEQKTQDQLAAVLVGAMTQDVYLAAAALNLKARYVMSLKAPVVKEGLKLADGENPLCLLVLGK
ncbi:MAG: nitroreductase family protein [Deltaproteobacteria bacterium]|jgi:nitroreductase|nr:nitroreductase family protein [Deltaproteobacteria bacterium]